MKAMILAAGRGQRMRPLSDYCPKPLLQVHGKPLLQYHIEALVNAGMTEIVINTCWLGEQIRAFCGDGARFGATIHFSDESPTALETAGGLRKALPLLGEQFVVINGDIHTDYDPAPLQAITLNREHCAHLVLVDNPAHHPEGDFALHNGFLASQGERLTFSGIGVYHASLFAGDKPAVEALGPILRKYCDQQRISAEHHKGHWSDVGTPERLQNLQA